MPEDETARIRIAVIGAGFISQYHIDGLRAAGGASVDVLVGRDRSRTQARAQALRVGRVETDYRRVLDDRSIDAVVIATPDNTHEAIAVDALQAGKAVLLQKPMALDTEQCRRILDVQSRCGTPLTVSFMHRYFPEVRWLRDLMRGGELGPVHSVRIRNATPGADWNDWFYAEGQVAGGVVMQLGVHGIDLCRHLFGDVIGVTAQTDTRRPERRLKDGRLVTTTLEDTALAIYRFSQGFVGSHDMSYTERAGCDRFRLELYAEGGTVWLRTERGRAVLFAPSVTGQDEWVTPDLPDEPFGAVHHRHWLSVVRGEATDDTALSGLASIAVAEGIYRSAAEGRFIDLAAFSETSEP
jgi:predicted dehydrogenase